jgi:hypothetical protein
MRASWLGGVGRIPALSPKLLLLACCLLLDQATAFLANQVVDNIRDQSYLSLLPGLLARKNAASLEILRVPFHASKDWSAS